MGGGGQWRNATGGGGLAGDAKQGLRPPIATGQNTNLKRRAREIHLWARKGRRGAGGADRGEGGAPAAAL
jgi:hypothetical protein